MMSRASRILYLSLQPYRGESARGIDVEYREYKYTIWEDDEYWLYTSNLSRETIENVPFNLRLVKLLYF
jgi:hypothetical protein